MRRMGSREELLKLRIQADPWFVERELLKAIKQSSEFKTAVATVAARFEARCLALSPDFEREPIGADREGRTSEPGPYRHETRTLTAPKRRAGRPRPPLFLVGVGVLDADGARRIKYEDLVLN